MPKATTSPFDQLVIACRAPKNEYQMILNITADPFCYNEYFWLGKLVDTDSSSKSKTVPVQWFERQHGKKGGMYYVLSNAVDRIFTFPATAHVDAIAKGSIFFTGVKLQKVAKNLYLLNEDLAKYDVD